MHQINSAQGQERIYRATVPIPYAQRENLRSMVRAAGARSFVDLIQLVVQRPEEAGKALAHIVHDIAGSQRKQDALEKLKAAATREGLTLLDIQHAFFEKVAESDQPAQ